MGVCLISRLKSDETHTQEVVVKNTDQVLTEQLLFWTEEPDSELTSRIAALGPAVVARTVLAEVASQARWSDGPAESVPVVFDLGFADGRVRFTMTVRTGSAELEPGARAGAHVIIRQELADLLREVWGREGEGGATREISIRMPADPAAIIPGSKENLAVRREVLAAHQVLRPLSQRPADLTELAVRFDSDKWGQHWYTPLYERYLSRYRDRRVKILEIGIGGYDVPGSGGASLRMWKTYFRRGLVYGIDMFDKSDLAEPRLYPIQGNQGDPDFLDATGTSIGPFDVIIDDGSHFNSDVVASFHTLFGHVRAGGMYIIEDTQTSYWPGWGGSSSDLNRTDTTMGLVKALVDGLNHQERVRDDDNGDTRPTDLTVTGVHVHHNVAVIEKGINNEASAPPWMPRTEDALAWFGRMKAAMS
jgi:demethylmacrocin O-methyltransferase